MQEGHLADGTQILPVGWMKESTGPSKGYAGYGYLWWLKKGSYAAQGVFGQLIYINPDQKLVIATHSAYDTAGSRAYSEHRWAMTSNVQERMRTG